MKVRETPLPAVLRAPLHFRHTGISKWLSDEEMKELMDLGRGFLYRWSSGGAADEQMAKAKWLT